MPFLRPLDQTAPNAGPDLPWPIDGLAYVAAFLGPMSAGLMIGALTLDWRAFAIGLPMGIAIAFLNAWLSDKFVDPCIANFQRSLQKGMPWVLANIAAFAWGIILCALSMLSPVVILGSAVLTRIR
jgi:hypothetical protein